MPNFFRIMLEPEEKNQNWVSPASNASGLPGCGSMEKMLHPFQPIRAGISLNPIQRATL